MPESFQARLVEAKPLAPGVRELTFERVDRPLAFAPGQWVNVALPASPAGPLVRAYSIASAPNGTGRFELAVTRVTNGPGSQALHELAVGAEVTASGPQGFFTRDADDGRPSLFVGTGTGVTPLRSMIHAALAAGATERLVLLVGMRHEADVLYEAELAALRAAHPNLEVHVTLSQPRAEWSGRRGYVQTHVPELLTSLGPEAHVYVCGLERMVKAVRDLTRKELGLPRERVHSERYD